MSKKQTSLFKFFGTPSPKTLSRGASKINQNQDPETKENAKSGWLNFIRLSPL